MKKLTTGLVAAGCGLILLIGTSGSRSRIQMPSATEWGRTTPSCSVNRLLWLADDDTQDGQARGTATRTQRLAVTPRDSFAVLWLMRREQAPAVL